MIIKTKYRVGDRRALVRRSYGMRQICLISFRDRVTGHFLRAHARAALSGANELCTRRERRQKEEATRGAQMHVSAYRLKKEGKNEAPL